MGHRHNFRPSIITLATAYAEQNGETEDALIIPEDLTALSDADLTALHAEALEAFDALHGDGTDLSDDDLLALSALTEGIESLAAEVVTRQEAQAERANAAAELAARIRPADDSTEELAAETDAETEEGAEASAEENGEDEDSAAEAEAEVETADEPELVAASSAPTRKAVRVPRSKMAARSAKAAPHRSNTFTSSPQDVREVLFASGEGLGIVPGKGVDFMELAAGVDRRMASFNKAQYDNAARTGRRIREQQNLAVVRKPFAQEHIIASSDPQHVSDVIKAATDESKLSGGSLVAAGGWCAPSEVMYDLFTELESRDGLLSLPEVNLARGGVRWSPGPSFTDIYSDITGFTYTEDDDIAGDYDGEGGGEKPCYHIECPDFDEVRLDVDGLCLTAGLLQARGYPEIIARTIRGALVAHDHRINARVIQAIASGSTAVTMPATQAGTAAPVLTSIGLQAEHYRYTHRMSRSATLEAVFPFWVRGAVRSDLSRRLGVDLLSVPDARIDAWFRERGINPQFVYNWQNFDSTATASATAWPTTVSFLLYAAGTWVRGSNDVITVDNLYDSTLLGQNNYTALFTEEGWATIKAGHDSRLVTTSITADGATRHGIDIEHNGTASVEGGE